MSAGNFLYTYLDVGDDIGWNYEQTWRYWAGSRRNWHETAHAGTRHCLIAGEMSEIGRTSLPWSKRWFSIVFTDLLEFRVWLAAVLLKKNCACMACRDTKPLLYRTGLNPPPPP